MKKNLLVFSAFCLSISGTFGQSPITITTADVAVPTKIIYQAFDSVPTISIGSPGVSQAWNMSGLHASSLDTITILPYSSALDSTATFPTSNLVIKQGWHENYAYFVNSSTEFSVLGYSGNLPVNGTMVPAKQFVTPSDKLATFPLSYNDNFSSDYISHAKFYFGQTFNGITIDSIRQKSVVKKTVLVDAWGSLTTPLGTYNVIRTKETKVHHDTIEGYVGLFSGWIIAPSIGVTADSSVSYTWWANGLGYSLVTATMDSTGGFKTVKWLNRQPEGVQEYYATTEVIVFPNPAQGQVTFLLESSKAKSIQVFDIAGKLVNEYKIDNDKVIINTLDFARGIYTYSIIGKDNLFLNHGKFTVAK